LLAYIQLGGDDVEELPDRFATKRFRVTNLDSDASIPWLDS